MTAPAEPGYTRGYLVADKYELEAPLGQGSMGAVWRARHLGLDTSLAIKVLNPRGDRAALRERLLQEARAAAKLTHPAIIKVFDVGETASSDPYIVMELLHGESLGAVLASHHRLPAVHAVRMLLPIADALRHAHDRGIVHRDVKPDNIFIVEEEGSIQPKLVDFGIVKLSHDSATHLTESGTVVGSPDYMSPEQARGDDDVDHLSDVWAFSVVLYETISGRTPFTASSYNALLRQILEDTPPSLQDLAVADAALSALVARGLSKDRAQRFPAMAELGQGLAAWLVAQDIHEDICGTTLETKWFGSGAVRSTPRRAPRAGVALEVAEGAETLAVAPAQAAIRLSARSVWFAAAWLLTTLIVTGLWLFGANRGRAEPALSPGAAAPIRSAPRESEPEVQATRPSSAATVPTAASAASAEQPASLPSSKAARPASGARTPLPRREIARPPAPATGSAGMPRDPKADLIRPY
jgi:serine/threonine-protein kinase